MHQHTQRLLARPALKALSPNGALAVSRTARRVCGRSSPQVSSGLTWRVMSASFIKAKSISACFLIFHCTVLHSLISNIGCPNDLRGILLVSAVVDGRLGPDCSLQSSMVHSFLQSSKGKPCYNPMEGSDAN
jgi:hypothetical protein